MAYDPSDQLEQKYGLTPYEISKTGTKYYRKDIAINQYIMLYLIKGSVSIEINNSDGLLLIPIAERYVPKNNEELDFLLTGSSRLINHFHPL